MSARRSILRFLIGALAMMFITGSTLSTVAAASPAVDDGMMSMPMDSGCDQHSKPQSCADFCVLVCGAIAPLADQLSPPLPAAAILADRARASSVPFSSGPEPPPPRG